MRIGLSTPVLVRMPGAFAPWEGTAGPSDLRCIAETADDLGFDHLTCSEHVAVPKDVAKLRGGVYYDPVATLAWLGAHTRRIRLATSVLVLGYHHPLAIAKRFGTLDLLTGGRVVLGVGVGSLAEEFALLGADFECRGPIADDRLRALRVALASTEPAYDGTDVSFGDVIVEPGPCQARVPIWVGGRTPRSLRRALELGDGWMPFGLDHARLRELLASVDLPPGYEIVLSPPGNVDPLGAPDACRRSLEELREAGATIAQLRLTATSAHHYCEQLAAAKELADVVG